MNNYHTRPVLVIFILLINLVHISGFGQTAASPWQAKYATGGTGAHVGEICWLTWGSSGNTVSNGTYYWNLTPAIQAVATITGITSDGNNATPLVAYNTGSYSGDGLQVLYSGVNPIGLRDRVSGDGVSFNISIQLMINGNSVSYPGMVIGDAESMAVNEYITAETGGTGWQVLDLRNNAPASTQNDYQLIISNLQKKFTIQTVNSSNQGMQAVLFAQGANSLNNVKLKGSGLTALAIGFIVPFDFGDAPASYGSAGHYINGFTPTGATVTNGTYPIVNIAKSNLVPTANVYMGSANVDADAYPPYSLMANYDDTSGVDDEDGVSFTGGSPKVNQTGNYPVTVSATNKSSKDATIYGWIDFNVDGIFSSNELAMATVPAGTTSPTNFILNYNLNNYSYAAGTFRAGAAYARFRITTDNLINSNAATAVDQRSQSAAGDGEVEDYRIDISSISISGNVFNDANGLADSLVNGILINTMFNSQIYVYFSQGGAIVYKAQVAADGSYTYPNANPGGLYVLTLSTDGTQNTGAPVSSVNTNYPTPWTNTGATYGLNNLWGSGISSTINGKMTVSIGNQNQDVTQVNFGVSLGIDALLPMKLIDFTANKTNDGVNISWKTADENNIKGFEVEYSSDGNSWANLGFISSSKKGGDEYLFTDHISHNNVNSFYRLKIIDNDGRFSWSAVRIISNSISSNIQYYPNPTKGQVFISSPVKITGIEVSGMSGSTVLSYKGTDIHEINLQRLQRGCYILRMFRGTQMIACPMVVKQ